MSSVAAQVRSAVVSALNDAVSNEEFGEITFVATDQLLPELDETALSTLRVVVVNAGQQVSRLTKAMRQNRITIAVNIMKYVGFSDGEVNQTEFEKLEELVELIAIKLADPLAGFEQCGPQMPLIDPPYDVEMAQQGFFMAAVGAEYVTTMTVARS